MERAELQLPVHPERDVVQGADAVSDGVAPFGPQQARVPGNLVIVERVDLQHLLLHPEGYDVQKRLIVPLEGIDLVLAIGADDGLRQIHQYLGERVVEREEIVRVGHADLREVSLLQMGQHDVAVLLVVDELLEISLFRLLKIRESHEVGDAVAARGDQEEVLALELHPVPLRPDVEVVSGEHHADPLDIVVLDDGVGYEVFLLPADARLGDGEQAVEFEEVAVGLLAQLFQPGIEEQVGDLHQCGPVVMLQPAQLDLYAAVVTIFQHRIDVDRLVAALLGLLYVVVDRAFYHEGQLVLVFQQPVVQFVDLLRRRHDAAAAGDVLGPVDLHLWESHQFADDRLDSFHAVSADAVVVYLVGRVLQRLEDDGQRLLVAEPQFLQHLQVGLGDVLWIAPDPVAQPLVVLV